MLKLKVIVGSTRPGRAAERVIPWIVGRAEAHRAFDVEGLDLRTGRCRFSPRTFRPSEILEIPPTPIRW